MDSLGKFCEVPNPYDPQKIKCGPSFKPIPSHFKKTVSQGLRDVVFSPGCMYATESRPLTEFRALDL